MSPAPPGRWTERALRSDADRAKRLFVREPLAALKQERKEYVQARDEFARTVRDMIRLNVNERTLDVLVEGSELSRRRAAWTPPARKDERGYRALYEEHVLQAHEGCDLDFLRGRSEIVMDAVTYV